MAVLIEGISLVIRRQAIAANLPGGWQAFVRIVPNQTLCADPEIARVGFMALDDAQQFVAILQGRGFTFLRGGAAVDIAPVDQLAGLKAPASWLEFGYVNLDGNGPRVAACRLKGSLISEIVLPPGWTHAESLTSNFTYVPSNQIAERLESVEQDGGLDTYRDRARETTAYVGISYPQLNASTAAKPGSTQHEPATAGSPVRESEPGFRPSVQRASPPTGAEMEYHPYLINAALGLPDWAIHIRRLNVSNTLAALILAAYIASTQAVADGVMYIVLYGLGFMIVTAIGRASIERFAPLAVIIGSTVALCALNLWLAIKYLLQ